MIKKIEEFGDQESSKRGESPGLKSHGGSSLELGKTGRDESRSRKRSDSGDRGGARSSSSSDSNDNKQ